MNSFNKNLMIIAVFAAGTAWADKGEKFADMDQNGDGQVTAAESETAAGDKFAKADANQDGQLTKGELTGFMIDQKNKGAGKAGRKSEKKVAKFDANGDGMLTRQEFMDGSKTMFSKKDVNGDGVLTMEEVERKRE